MDVLRDCQRLGPPFPHAYSLALQVAANFRKTATNFHYEFNIRHLSNVFQGLLVAQPDQFKTAEKFVQLWMHESERVYGDRLVWIPMKSLSHAEISLLEIEDSGRR